jgi:hypothetical protein
MFGDVHLAETLLRRRAALVVREMDAEIAATPAPDPPTRVP